MAEVEEKKLTVEELKEELDAQGIEYPASARKADLEALLEEADKGVGEGAGNSGGITPHESRPVTANASKDENRKDDGGEEVPQYSRPSGSY